jgi:hypothetical protein
VIRTLLLIVTFLFSLSLITLAYSQSDIEQTLDSPVTQSPTSGCAVGSQLSPTVEVGDGNKVKFIDKCSRFSAFIQGACCCDFSGSGELGCPNNPVCVEAQGASKPN